MKRTQSILLGLGLLGLLLLVGCLARPGPGRSGTPLTPAGALAPVVATLQEEGIRVTGEGRVTVSPDLAFLHLGVEARASTATQARLQAAEAMTRVMKALQDHGIRNRDIQTQSFSIQPQFDERGSKIIGYRVTNLVRVKVRDLEKLGSLIDEAAAAGGDLIRVQGVRFTVEELEPHRALAREKAVQDALAKARHFARLSGVTLGRLVSLSEVGVPIPERGVFLEAMPPPLPTPPTPILGGEIEIVVRIQATFAIE